MYSSEEKGAPPRISFSNDFAESHSRKQLAKQRDQPPPLSTDFEFSVSSCTSSLHQLTADQLFSKGRILPSFKDPTTTTTAPPTTLRDDRNSSSSTVNGDAFSLFKGRWKALLGLRKSHIASTKPDSSAH